MKKTKANPEPEVAPEVPQEEQVVTTMRVKQMPLNQVVPYWRNPRNISDDAVDGVVRSIKLYGFNQPIVLDSENVIIVGHTRYKAALKLKLKKVPCYVATHLTDDQVSAYRIADNKTAEKGQWDENKLLEELKTLSDHLVDIQPFFNEDIHDLVQKSSGLASTPVTPDALKQAEDALKNSMKGADQQTGRKDVYCPHCGGAFNVST